MFPTVDSIDPERAGSLDALRDRPLDLSNDDARYDALRRRDKRADGQLFYSVASTGVYCRPSCGARLALRKNVAFHNSCAEAESAGFRPCKRCRPHEHTDRTHALITDLRTQLESSEAPKTLAALAARVGLSPFYLQRLFKQHVGMTPRAYAAAHRLQRVESELRNGRSVTAALYEAGYSSSSRFYESESGALGVAPATLRGGSSELALRIALSRCSLGEVLVAASTRGICAIAFGDSAEALHEELRSRFPRAQVLPSDAELEALTTRVVALVEGAHFADDLPLDLIGTAFQQKVWRALRAIPRGQTRSYGQLAESIGSPGAARAVGTACGQNPVAVLVPCHRVLRGDGSLAGYRWRAERKQQLLEREARK